MFGKKRGFTASQSKRMSRRMESSTIGTHVARPQAPRTRTRSSRASRAGAHGASGMDFSSRRAREANRGYVSHVGTSARSGESDNAYSRRVSRLSYAQEIQRKARMRRIVFFAAALVVVLAVAAGVGVATFFGSSDSKLSLGSSNASDALVAAADGEPYYVLCAAELDSASNVYGARTDAYLLVRVDETARVLTFVSIPSNLEVRLSDGNAHALCDAREVGGDAELIAQVSKLAEVDISHYAFTDAAGIAGMVEAVGGVSLDLSEEVDDPRAGTVVLPAGTQALDGPSALVLLRATNFSTGLEAAAGNRVAFTLALAERALESEGLSFATLVGEAGNYVSCDWGASDLIALGDALRPLSNMTVYSCLLPGYETAGDVSYYECYDEDWQSMLALVKAGSDPNTLDSSAENVVPSEVTVDVRNGGGATGAGARMGSLLTSAGYAVESVDNVDDGTLYPETLVVYRDPAFEGAAKAIVRAAGGGRVVNGGDFYEFDVDVRVIVGKDWMPVS